MAGFRSLARQVRDPRCDLALRRYSLRKCLERFAPYGHRATWDHLCSRAGFGPEDRNPDPARLVAALEELEEARSVWLDYEVQFAQRRKKEKHDGLRRPGTVDDWHRLTWGGFGVAWCDDPKVHPREPMAEVLQPAHRRAGARTGLDLPGVRRRAPRLDVRPGPRTVLGPCLHGVRNSGASTGAHPRGPGGVQARTTADLGVARRGCAGDAAPPCMSTYGAQVRRTGTARREGVTPTAS